MPRIDHAARPDNAIDFWRGFALVTIFINHVPGNFYERFTHRNVSTSDSAELFVFLAGWALRRSLERDGLALPVPVMLRRLGRRALAIYAAQTLLVMLALAMLAAAARGLDNPLLLEWYNAAAVFYDPVNAHIGLALLTHQLGYFDILPLYVVLMFLAPAMALVHRWAPALLLPASLALYLVTLVRVIPMPTWPVQGQWFFNPLAWQLVFVLGFELAGAVGEGSFIQRHIGVLRAIAAPILIVTAVMVWTHWYPDPTRWPEPRLLFLQQKTYATPVRLIQFLALLAVFSAAFPWLQRHARPPTRFLAMLGRHSLNVFCVGSLTSLAGQIVRFASHGGILVDTAILLVGLLMLGFTAWISEWPER